MTKKVKRWFTPQGCYVESKRSLFLDTHVILEEIVISTKVDFIDDLKDAGLIKWES